ncbi:MAG TPA: hypothetical protein VGR72_07875 [Candidatus Acidoferrales bacterium]|nr:hypothetical protein [Candidatus Acidoferrales bacterium]
MLSANQLTILRCLREVQQESPKKAWHITTVYSICRKFDQITFYFATATGVEAFSRLLLKPGILSISPDGTWCKLTDYGLALWQETEALQREWEELPTIPLDDAEKDQIIINQGEAFRGKMFVLQLFKRAHETIRLHDNFCATELLTWLYSVPTRTIQILTSARTVKQDRGFKSFYEAFRRERNATEVRITDDVHDRKIIIDEREAFQVGESIKDIGHKGTTIVRLTDPAAHAAQFEKLWSEAKPL